MSQVPCNRYAPYTHMLSITSFYISNPGARNAIDETILIERFLIGLLETRAQGLCREVIVLAGSFGVYY